MIIELVRKTLAFLVLTAAMCWPIELLFPRRAPRVTPREWLADVLWLLAGAATLTFVVVPLLGALPQNSHHELWRFALAFAGAEWMAYWSHRAMHHFPTLRRFHAVHHDDPRRLDWLKTWRQHPVDVAIHALAVGLPGVLLGAPLSTFAALIFVRRLWGAFLHANTRIRLGRLEALIASPHFHHAHHSNPAHNYAGLFPFLDRWFGTHAP